MSQPRRPNGVERSKSHVSSILLQSIFLEDHGTTGLKVSSCPLDDSGAMLFAGRLSMQGRLDSSRSENENCDYFDDENSTGWEGEDPIEDTTTTLPPQSQQSEDNLNSNQVLMGRNTSPLPTISGKLDQECRRETRNPLSLMDPHEEAPIYQSGYKSSIKVTASKPMRIAKCYKRPSEPVVKHSSLSAHDEVKQEYSRFLDVAFDSHKAEFVNSNLNHSTKESNFGWTGVDSVPTLATRKSPVSFKMTGLINNRVLGRVLAQQRRKVFLDRLHRSNAARNNNLSAGEDNQIHEENSIGYVTEPSSDVEETYSDHGVDDMEFHSDDSPENDLEVVLQQSMTEAGSETGISSFENLCKHHMENFLQSAELYARETQLSRRISAWVTKLEPLLLAEESSRVYDISEYSDKVLCKASLCALSSRRISEPEPGSLKVDNELNVQQIGFEEITAGESTRDVCRIFVACLQLANFGNISISENCDTDNGFNFSLLSGTRNKDVENYRAPSLESM